MTWGEQTDVPESADWYNAGYPADLGLERAADPHAGRAFLYRGPLQGHQERRRSRPDYAEATKFADLWLHPKQGTDAALAMAMGHVILREFHLDRTVPYFDDYVRRYTDLPMLVRLVRKDGRYVPDRLLRAEDFADALGEANNAAWKTVAFDADGNPVVPLGSVGFRWGEQGKWNLEAAAQRRRGDVAAAEPGRRRRDRRGRLPLFRRRRHQRLHRDRPSRRADAQRAGAQPRAEGRRDAGRDGVRSAVRQLRPGSRLGRRQRRVRLRRRTSLTRRPGPSASPACRARTSSMSPASSPTNAEKTNGRSMVILGAGLNHWYHMDMTYRGIINLLVLCGCIGQSGGGWSHYVGQEKLRPQTGWLPVAFGLDWNRPPRQHERHVVLLRAHRPVALRDAEGRRKSCRRRRRTATGPDR